MYTVRVLENRKESDDAFTLILNKPEDFAFTAGQFVHLQTLVEGRPLRRSYTIASAPQEQHIHITIRTQQQGKVSPVLQELIVGDELLMLGPFGDFTRGDEKHSVFVAAGSGITPFISYLRDQQKTQSSQHVTLLYSNKHKEDMLYADELQDLQTQDWFEYVATLTQSNWEKRTGRFGIDDLRSLVDEDTVFYLCGSNTFVRAFTNHLQQLEVPVEYIRTENYGNIKS